MPDDEHTGTGGHAGSRHQQGAAGFGGGPECTLCPLCVFLQALTSTRPEVTRHLLAAGRELTLALGAALEQQAEAGGRARERLQHIRID
jgi:hypothetical protein